MLRFLSLNVLVIASNRVPYVQMISVGSHSMYRKEKDGKKGKNRRLYSRLDCLLLKKEQIEIRHWLLIKSKHCLLCYVLLITSLHEKCLLKPRDKTNKTLEDVYIYTNLRYRNLTTPQRFSSCVGVWGLHPFVPSKSLAEIRTIVTRNLELLWYIGCKGRVTGDPVSIKI